MQTLAFFTGPNEGTVIVAGEGCAAAFYFDGDGVDYIDALKQADMFVMAVGFINDVLSEVQS